MAAIEFSDYALDFISYDDSFLDVLEGTTGGGKTVDAIYKFIKKVYFSKNKFHIISCLNTVKSEQNIILDDNCGAIALFKTYVPNEYGQYEEVKLVNYYPNGKGMIKNAHLTIKGKDGLEKIIYFISYNDKTKSQNIRGGRYGCIFIDEVNQVADDTPGQVPQFVTECLSRADDYVVMTLNPDDPEKPIYDVINQARPIEKYKNKGPKEIRNLLNADENPRYKWWFFDFYDNPYMTEERIQSTIDGAKTNKKDFDSRIRGLRRKTTSLAFPNFDEDFNVITENEVLERKNGDPKYEHHIKFRSFTAGVDTSWSPHTKDLIVFVYAGVTYSGEVYILDEFTFNNSEVRRKEDRMAASDAVPLFVNFLFENSKKWGYPEYAFVDEADSNFMMEFDKYKRTHTCPFRVAPSAKKKFNITARKRKVNELIDSNKYWVVDKCKTHIYEMNVITVDEKDNSKTADINNHTYDAICYAIERAYLCGWLGTQY